MPLLRTNVAMSLDGFIARADGSYDWIPADPGVDFVALFAQFDHFVMGRRTFEVVQALGEQDPTRGRSILVASRTLPPSTIPGVEVVGAGLAERLRALKATPGRDLWLFGGASLFRELLDLGLVDQVEVSVIPILLGGGIPLVSPGRSRALRLLSQHALPNGILQLVYAVAPD
ncbi:MAG: dihydrofolate reductase [Geothrix sp.]|uniref:dihydrofolate reductase family protein n=1 Tax=Geothrix sp. TaxID=1962974 RepID=UPI0018171D91|nr:dihydrofolate reductase family protein [Geothrix sp.]NWJ42574.1 dihydrofolate reductase [Geothrix sp.]WIL19466.1 MAG: dihydrofolate reductase family protein [Geothrix sp.]